MGYRSEKAPKSADEEALAEDDESKSPPHQDSEDSSSSSSSDSENVGRSQAFRRMPRFSNRVGALRGGTTADGEDEDDEPAFLPFTANQDPSATLRNLPGVEDQANAGPAKPSHIPKGHQRAESSASSTSSAAATGAPNQRTPGALSPRHRAELAKLSPRLQRGGSDGAPSMGSSFSDLDGALNSSTTSLRSGYDRILPNR